MHANPVLTIPDSLCLRKYDLIQLTPYRWQPYISEYCDITKGT